MINAERWTPWGDLGATNDNIPAEVHALGSAIGKVIPAADENLPPVVAFTGLAGAGKSTASRYLVERYGYHLVKFAAPLKDMMRAIGLNEDDIEGGRKETPSALLCGQTPRHAMQTLGTQWGRDCIGKTFWVDLWRARAANWPLVVVDDCRFPNEAAAIRKMGGDIILISGRGGIAGDHESERGIACDPDLAIANNGSVEALHRRIEDAIRRWG